MNELVSKESGGEFLLYQTDDGQVTKKSAEGYAKAKYEKFEVRRREYKGGSLGTGIDILIDITSR